MLPGTYAVLDQRFAVVYAGANDLVRNEFSGPRLGRDGYRNQWYAPGCGRLGPALGPGQALPQQPAGQQQHRHAALPVFVFVVEEEPGVTGRRATSKA